MSFTMEARGSDSERPFFEGARAEDTFAEELGEGTVSAMTSGEDRVSDDLNREVEEDWGGPFVMSSASKEFASGTVALPNDYSENKAIANGGNGLLVGGSSADANIDGGANAGLVNAGAIQCQIAGVACQP